MKVKVLRSKVFTNTKTKEIVLDELVEMINTIRNLQDVSIECEDNRYVAICKLHEKANTNNNKHYNNNGYNNFNNYSSNGYNSYNSNNNGYVQYEKKNPFKVK